MSSGIRFAGAMVVAYVASRVAGFFLTRAPFLSSIFIVLAMDRGTQRRKETNPQP